MRLTFVTTLIAWLALTIATLASTAGAHGAALQAFVALSPPAPTVGQHTVKVLLRDAYNSPITGASFRIMIETPGSRLVKGPELREEAPGIYRGQITFTDPGPVLLGLEAVLPDGPWQGKMPITIGPGGRMIQAMGVSLRHLDAPLVTLLGWVVVGAFVLGVAGIALLGVRLFLDKGQVAQAE